MNLNEAKKLLKNNGYIIEDTETLDDKIEDIERQSLKPGTANVYKMNKQQANKFSKLWDRARDSSIENKVNKAVNFNIKQFFTGLEEKFEQYFENFTIDHMNYDTKQNFQPVSYWFDDDNIEFQVDYWDEKGFIDLGLIDIKKGTRKNKKFKITKIDENIEEVFNWFFEKVENYDQSEW